MLWETEEQKKTNTHTREQEESYHPLKSPLSWWWSHRIALTSALTLAKNLVMVSSSISYNKFPQNSLTQWSGFLLITKGRSVEFARLLVGDPLDVCHGTVEKRTQRRLVHCKGQIPHKQPSDATLVLAIVKRSYWDICHLSMFAHVASWIGRWCEDWPTWHHENILAGRCILWGNCG